MGVTHLFFPANIFVIGNDHRGVFFLIVITKTPRIDTELEVKFLFAFYPVTDGGFFVNW